MLPTSTLCSSTPNLTSCLLQTATRPQAVAPHAIALNIHCRMEAGRQQRREQPQPKSRHKNRSLISKPAVGLRDCKRDITRTQQQSPVSTASTLQPPTDCRHARVQHMQQIAQKQLHCITVLIETAQCPHLQPSLA